MRDEARRPCRRRRGRRTPGIFFSVLPILPGSDETQPTRSAIACLIAAITASANFLIDAEVLMISAAASPNGPAITVMSTSCQFYFNQPITNSATVTIRWKASFDGVVEPAHLLVGEHEPDDQGGERESRQPDRVRVHRHVQGHCAEVRPSAVRS